TNCRSKPADHRNGCKIIQVGIRRESKFRIISKGGFSVWQVPRALKGAIGNNRDSLDAHPFRHSIGGERKTAEWKNCFVHRSQLLLDPILKAVRVGVVETFLHPNSEVE